MTATPAMNVKMVAVSRLIEDPNNARVHSRENLDAIRNSYQLFQQMIPIVLASDGRTVLAGNGRLQVAREMGLEYIAVVRADHLTEEQQRAYALADNRTAELAAWDSDKLRSALESLTDATTRAATGFTDMHMQAMGMVNPADISVIDPVSGLPGSAAAQAQAEVTLA